MATELAGAGISALGGLFAGLGQPSIENPRPDPNYQLVSNALATSGGSLSGGSIMGEALAHAQGLRDQPVELLPISMPSFDGVRVPGMPASVGMNPGAFNMFGDAYSLNNQFPGDWHGANPGQGGGSGPGGSGPGGINPDNDGTRPPAQNNNWGGGPDDVTGGWPGTGIPALRTAGDSTYNYDPSDYEEFTASIDRALAELSLRASSPVMA